MLNVRAGLGISGIYDHEPIRHSDLNVKLGPYEAASRRNSPMMVAGGAMKPLSLLVGPAAVNEVRSLTVIAQDAACLPRPGNSRAPTLFTIMDKMMAAARIRHSALA